MSNDHRSSAKAPTDRLDFGHVRMANCAVASVLTTAIERSVPAKAAEKLSPSVVVTSTKRVVTRLTRLSHSR